MNKDRFLSILPYGAWLIALASLLGSLYFSEIEGFMPCVLCWYQRICMYPLVVIIPTGILGGDSRMPLYALPLSIVGSVIALYQNLLTWGVITETAEACKFGICCTTEYINWFGFITIPFLSLLSFLAITGALIILYKTSKTDHDPRD